MFGLRPTRLAGVAVFAATAILAPGAMAHHRRVRRGHAAAVCLDSATPVRSAPRAALRAAVLCLVNKERAAHGLPPLGLSAELNRSAQGWANAMVASGSFSHGADFAGRITGAGYHWSAAGENIASGFATARGVVRAWMSDVGHCQNILSPAYRDLGVGINPRSLVRGGRGAATWTQDFGRRLSQSPRSNNWGPANGCPYG